jgi:Peptidase M60, enhancin and enhancin-like/N-terminal domain of M60-like peptidases/Secretion system C-terminal sorting domain
MVHSSAHPQTVNIQRTFALVTLCFFLSAQWVFAQGPPGYTWCASENQSFTLPGLSHVAYGGNNSFSYLYNQTGTITFNNTTFGDPAPGVVKSGYYKIASSEGSLVSLEAAFQQLKGQITGVLQLSGQQLNNLSDSIQQNIFSVADTGSMVAMALDIIDCYETLKGPIFFNASTQNGFPNNFDALDGKELARAVFVVQQGVFDHVYTPVNISKYIDLLANRKFKTADYFPGICPNPIDSSTTYTAKIKASLPPEYGKGTAFSDAPARRPTGYYLAPGKVGTVKVPPGLVNKGFRILVGAHTVNRGSAGQVGRFFRVTNTFPIEDTITQIINPFGGGIYVVVPYLATEGIADIQLTNVVPAPFFSAQSASTTSLQEWQTTQRSNPAPWADFASDKYMMQVPTKWIYNYSDPVTLMQDWNNRMDVVAKLLGQPLTPNNIQLYLQVDVGIQYNGFYGIGNPQVNNTYSPSQVENGNKNHWLIRPGVGFWETEFHEMGHAQLFSKFPGETEAAVNVPAAALYNRLYGMGIDSALGKSFGNHPYITRDQAALNWMVTPNFRAGNPMDISNTTKDEVRYQQRGYAKYIEMAALFGWEVIDSFHKKEQLDFINQAPGDGLTEVDSRILRFSKTTGADMRPLVHFWGVHPKNQAVLKSAIDAAGLQPSKLVCERLTHYKSIIPLNNAQFQAHANAFFGGSVPAGGHPDYGSGWYNIWLPQYNETHGALAQQSMQAIIDLYFPGGCPTSVPTPVVTVNSASICPGQSATLTASGAMYYQWSNGETGNTITVSPNATTTYTVIGKTAGFSAAPVSAEVTVNPIPDVSVNNTSICAGQSATLTASGAETYAWSNGESSASIIVSPTETTTFTVIGTTAGCAAAPLTAEVTVNPVPEVSVGNAIICAGQSATLTASGAETYAWSNGESSASIIVSPTETTTFTVTGTTSGCTAAPMMAEVIVNPVPVVSVGNASICAGQSATLMASGAETYIWSNGESGASITVNPTESTTFTVTGTTAGCAAAPLTAEVTVNPIPEVSVGNAIICAGQSATLTASGAENYTWSNGESGASISVSPTESATFTVVGTSLGCSSLPTQSTVTVNALPSVTITTEQQGQSTLLDATGQGLTYLWSTGELTASILVNTSGIYTVTVTNAASCSAVFSISVTVTSSVKDPYDGIEIMVAPNPVTDVLNILVSGSSTTNLRILDNLGRVVLAEQTFVPDGTLRTLSVAILPAGAYYLQIAGTNFVRTVCIVKQ